MGSWKINGSVPLKKLFQMALSVRDSCSRKTLKKANEIGLVLLEDDQKFNAGFECGYAHGAVAVKSKVWIWARKQGLINWHQDDDQTEKEIKE